MRSFWPLIKILLLKTFKPTAKYMNHTTYIQIIIKQIKNLVVILLTLSKSKKHLSLLKIHTNIFLPTFYLCMSIFLSIHTFMNVKTSQRD